MNVIYPAPKKQKLTRRNVHRYNLGTRKPTNPLLGTSNNSNKECLVYGALATSLRVSRLMGVAPLRLDRDRGGWRASVSRSFVFYSYVFVFAMHTGCTTGFIRDFVLDDSELVRVGAMSSTVIAGARLFIIMSVVTFILVNGPKRMTDMIEYMNIINNIYIKHSNSRDWQPVQKNNKYIIPGTLLALGFTNLLAVVDRSINLLRYDSKDYLFILHFFSFFEYLYASLLESQYLCVGMLAEAAFGKINESLQDVLDIVEELRPQESRKTQDIITDIASSYDGACEVLARVSDSFGKNVVLILGAMFMDLVMAPYLLYAVVQNPNIHAFTVFIFVTSIAFNFANLVLIMEPGHGTETQMNQTKILLSHLLRRVDPGDPLALHLHFFFKQLSLNHASFTALGICTLTRPVILSILGGVTTYLVILLQFVSLDNVQVHT